MVWSDTVVKHFTTLVLYMQTTETGFVLWSMIKISSLVIGFVPVTNIIVMIWTQQKWVELKIIQVYENKMKKLNYFIKKFRNRLIVLKNQKYYNYGNRWIIRIRVGKRKYLIRLFDFHYANKRGDYSLFQFLQAEQLIVQLRIHGSRYRKGNFIHEQHQQVAKTEWFVIR